MSDREPRRTESALSNRSGTIVAYDDWQQTRTRCQGCLQRGLPYLTVVEFPTGQSTSIEFVYCDRCIDRLVTLLIGHTRR